MEYITLNNGSAMPMVGFGTWQLRGQTGQTAVRTALDSGYRLIDTARMYENEHIVGRAIAASGISEGSCF